MNLFQKVKVNLPSSNKFDLSHEKKMSGKMGNLYPILVADCLPGDNWRGSSEIFARFAPMLAPIMHRCDCRVDYFKVPYRLVWEQAEFDKWITGGDTGEETAEMPFIEVKTSLKQHFVKGNLADYMGFPGFLTEPATIDHPINISAIPFRAYQLIWNEYYRDQTLQDAIPISKASGEALNMAELLTMRKRCWEKDPFTSALPFAQRGPVVGLPIDTEIEYKTVSDIELLGGGAANGALAADAGALEAGGFPSRVENLEAVTATTNIKELRRATMLQAFYEKIAVGGARYVEWAKVIFGVKVSDARIQRPEWLGGGRTPVLISEVLSTFQQDAEGVPQGNPSGKGVMYGDQNKFSTYCEEHCYIIGLMSILPKTAYQDGVARHLTKFDRFDVGTPDFAQIGEQEILNQEVFYHPTHASLVPEGTFGYQSRYHEYKYIPSTVHGDFRGNLAFWGMQRIFTSPPVLDQSFVESNPTDRIFAVQDGTDTLWIQIYNRISAIRKLPYFGTPKL